MCVVQGHYGSLSADWSAVRKCVLTVLCRHVPCRAQVDVLVWCVRVQACTGACVCGEHASSGLGGR